MNLFSEIFEDRDQMGWPVSLSVICDHGTESVQMLMKSVGRRIGIEQLVFYEITNRCSYMQ